MLPPEKFKLFYKRKTREARYDRKQRLRHGGLTSAARDNDARFLAKAPKTSGVMARVSCRLEKRLKSTAGGADWIAHASVAKRLRKLGFYVKGKAGPLRLFSLTREGSHVTPFDFK
jgi:hypothetical protein